MSKHKDLIFIIIGALLLLITISIVVYSINFLVKNAGAALDHNSTKSREIVRFNLEGLSKLGIIK
ncbi:MAG: hypothetical protein Q8N28_02150 [bacterium]|nr:hypothetical protein [bacterium]